MQRDFFHIFQGFHLVQAATANDANFDVCHEFLDGDEPKNYSGVVSQIAEVMTKIARIYWWGKGQIRPCATFPALTFMNQQSLQNRLVNIMKTTNILNWAASLNVDDLGLDAQPATIVADDRLLMMRSTEVLDLAAGIEVDGFLLTDVIHASAV
jgi:hypothetical protein